MAYVLVPTVHSCIHYNTTEELGCRGRGNQKKARYVHHSGYGHVLRAGCGGYIVRGHLDVVPLLRISFLCIADKNDFEHVYRRVVCNSLLGGMRIIAYDGCAAPLL